MRQIRSSTRGVRVAVAGVAVLALALSACGDSGDDDSGASGASGGDVPGVDVEAKTITLGGWRVSSGPITASDANTRASIAHINKINDEGGINGWKINWDPPDSGADPSRALQITREQVESGDYFALYNGMGSLQNSAVLPYVKSTDMPYFAPATSNPMPEVCEFTPTVIPFPPAIASAGSLLAQYAYDNLDARKFFVVYSKDANGEPGLAGVSAFVPSMDGAEVIGKAPYAATDTDFTGIGRAIADADPDAVIVFGAVPAAMVKSKAEAIARGSDATWLATNVYANPFTVDLDPATMSGSYFYLPQIPFFLEDDPVVKEWSDTVLKYFPDEESLGGLSQSGYAPVYLLEEAIKRMTADGKEPTREGFIEAVQSFGQTGQIGNIAGVNYTEDRYEGINTYWLAKYEDGEWSEVGEPTKIPDFDFCSTL